MIAESSTRQINQRNVIVFSTALIVTIAFSIAAAGNNVLPGDAAVARFFQRAPATPVSDLADLGNWIGSARFCAAITFVLGLGLLVLRRSWEAAFMVSALALRSSNGLLKTILESPRPTADLVRVTELADHFGFPSGHAMGSTLCYGAIAIVASRLVENSATRKVIGLGCGVIVLWVGFSRVYIGAHWPSDVAGGYLWGLICLLAIVALLSDLRRRMRAE